MITLYDRRKYFLLNHTLSMTCQEYPFRFDTEVDASPGEYNSEVSIYISLCSNLKIVMSDLTDHE